MTAPVQLSTKKESWLERQHPHYQRWVQLVTFARAVYSGALLEPDRISDFLIQKAQGESDPAYEERRKLADFTNYFANVVDSFVGMVASVDGDATRQWVDKDNPALGLGDPNDSRTPIGRLYRHADPKGRGWITVWDLLSTELGIAHAAWPLVSTTGTDRQPRVTILPFERVPNWRYDSNGVLLEALVEEEVDGRTSIKDDERQLRQFMYYTQRRWERWELNTETKEDRKLDEGVYQGFVGPDGNPALPLWQASLAMQRHSGYLMARKNVVLFNKESELDALLRACGFPVFVFCGNGTDFEQAKRDRRQGVNFMHQPMESSRAHYYLSPDVKPAAIQLKAIEAKEKKYYATANKEYGDSARDRTATEAAQDVSQGAGAFVRVLKTALDDAENNAAWRVAQIVHPDDRRAWFVSKVERSDKFAPVDPDATAEKQEKRAFGDQPAPLGFAGQVAAAQDIARLQGLTVDDLELQAAVRVRMAADFFSKVIDAPAPPALKAQLVDDLASSMGLKLTGVREAALKLAERADLLRERETQSFPGGHDDDPDDDPEDPPDGPPGGGGGE